MTPEQLALLTTITGMLKMVATWPVGVILVAVVLGPWVLLIFMLQTLGKRENAAEKRFEAVVQMYTDNVLLVKNYDNVSNDLKDVVIMNTVELGKVHGEVRGSREDIAGNKFCPVMRVNSKRQFEAVG